MSTLLPRKDLHPDTIHRINSSMSRDCVLRPKVHVAHHPTLDVRCLYDHVHLFKNTVSIFTQTLKDVALNRDQSTPHRRSSSTHNPLRPTRHPTGPSTRQPPWRPNHPHLPSHHVPLRPHQGSYDPRQTRPEPLLPPLLLPSFIFYFIYLFFLFLFCYFMLDHPGSEVFCIWP